MSNLKYLYASVWTNDEPNECEEEKEEQEEEEGKGHFYNVPMCSVSRVQCIDVVDCRMVVSHVNWHTHTHATIDHSVPLE